MSLCPRGKDESVGIYVLIICGVDACNRRGSGGTTRSGEECWNCASQQISLDGITGKSHGKQVLSDGIAVEGTLDLQQHKLIEN